jgi:AAA+ superfamily predicted ATPase
MNQPLLHNRTKAQLELYLKNPSHALLLTGPEGVGKLYVAKWLAEEQGSTHSVVEKQEKLSTISIEQIRTLYSQTKTGREQTIIIHDSHSLGIEAQNAFLKLLEEPPANTRFILTANKARDLLATIRSRVRSVEVYAPSESQLIKYFNDQSDEFVQLVRISGGLPSTISKALSGENYKEALLEQMGEAKQFYSGDKFSRHKILIANSYEKQWSKTFLQNTLTIIKALINAKSTDSSALKKLAYQANLTQTTITNLTKVPGNPKIHLTKLAEML